MGAVFVYFVMIVEITPAEHENYPFAWRIASYVTDGFR